MEAAPDLVTLVQRFYSASTQSDVDFLDGFVDRDAGALIIGTDAEEWWSGGAYIIETWGAAWRRRGGPVVEGSNPTAFREGTVGWVADQARWRRPNGSTIGFRLSAVFHQVDGAWLLVQAHFSMGVPNEVLANGS